MTILKLAANIGDDGPEILVLLADPATEANPVPLAGTQGDMPAARPATAAPETLPDLIAPA